MQVRPDVDLAAAGSGRVHAAACLTLAQRLSTFVTFQDKKSYEELKAELGDESSLELLTSVSGTGRGVGRVAERSSVPLPGGTKLQGHVLV